jgi:signal transduction histidine kinase
MLELNTQGIDQDVLLAIVASTLLILLLISGITLAFYISGRQRIQQRAILAETKLAYEKELRTVETEVTEAVMTHFAQELHDNIGQMLTALHIQVENQKLDHPEIAHQFKPVEIQLADVREQLRMLGRTLNNDYLGNIGLRTAIQTEVNRLNNLKRFTAHFDPGQAHSNLEKNQELMVFRIFQEIAQNALKHSRAKNLYVSVVANSQSFRLEVKDDGKGFDHDAIMQTSRASGLRNIYKRVALAGLSLKINSSPGNGSLFIIEKKDILSS